MPDEHSEKMVQLLGEIRDLTKQRNDKLDALVQGTHRRADEAMQRYTEQQKQAKKRFYVSVATVFILGLMLFIVILVLTLPRR